MNAIPLIGAASVKTTHRSLENILIINLQFKTVIHLLPTIVPVINLFSVQIFFLAHILPAVFLLIETLVGCDTTWVIVLLTMSLGMNGATTITSLHNPQDLSPNYAPTIYGIVNSIASTTGFINPMIVGYLTAEHVSRNRIILPTSQQHIIS